MLYPALPCPEKTGGSNDTAADNPENVQSYHQKSPCEKTRIDSSGWI
jgi:hypothetical protein